MSDRKGTVLLADDNRLVMKVNSGILENAGYEVETAWDGVEAIRKAFSTVPDLILLDIEMPKIKGYQVCRLLKDDVLTSWIPIIMLTGREQQADMFWGLKTGAEKYITKGFKPESLIELVDDLMLKSKTKTTERDLAMKRRREITEEDVLSRVMNLLDTKLFETTVLNEIAQLGSTIQNFEDSVKSVFEILSRLITYWGGGLLLIQEGAIYTYSNKQIAKELLKGFEEDIVRVAESYIDESVQSAEYDIKELESDIAKAEKTVTSSWSESASCHIPLLAQKKVFGVLSLFGPTTTAFKRDAPAMLKLIGNEVTVVIDNARLYEAANKLAITDGLTKIYNHRFFQELFEKEFKRSDRYGTIFSLIMLDIDFFKKINDTYGHLAGDEILKEIAVLIKGCLRSMDIVARYGGEEFAILLPETNLEEAILTAERIRRAIEQNDFETPDNQIINVTVSQGVTSYPAQDISSRSDLVSKADTCLYEAKESGRNKVCHTK